MPGCIQPLQLKQVVVGQIRIILSGTGAGDTSIAAFLTAMLKGYPLERALQLSAATGASCVAAYDALSGLKSFEELEAKIDDGWQKNSGMMEQSE